MNSASITITPVVGENHLTTGLGNISSIAAASLRDHNEKVELKWKNINYQTLIKDPQASKFMKPVYKVKNMLVDVSGIIFYFFIKIINIYYNILYCVWIVLYCIIKFLSIIDLTQKR